MESYHVSRPIYLQGYESYVLGEDNPYYPGSNQWQDFEAGWQDACDEEHGYA